MAIQFVPRKERGTLASALVITRRELRDSLQDWRIVTPIIILTLVFPFLMDFTSRWFTNWVMQYTDNPILGERVNPFLLLIVGFFPISFSLIIALESFVGEKERNSIEPILSMPLTDLELYLGKMFSSLLLPLFASYLGISVFLLSRLFTSPPWIPPLELVVLIYLLITVEALVMVSGAVVVSSQTTSVRAANLLASFIIVPMALLIQVEAVIMFYAQYTAIWWIVAGLVVVNLMLVRMGIRIFNREHILSREMDELHFKTIWHDFVGYFLRPPELAFQRKNRQAARFSLLRFYVHDIPLLLKQQLLPFAVIIFGTATGIVLGAVFAQQYPFPPQAFPLQDITPETFENVQKIQFLPTISTRAIFFNNLRVIILGGIFSIVTLGSLTLLLTVINIGLVSFLIAQIIMLGYNPWLFVSTFILPHGIFEIPALLIGMTFALRMGAALISPPNRVNIGQAVLLTGANFAKVLLLLVIPLLLLAAFIEANITPQIILSLYGG